MSGVESMTHGYGAGAVSAFSDEMLESKDEDCLLPMTSEHATADYGITREAEDGFDAHSPQKAARAQKGREIQVGDCTYQSEMGGTQEREGDGGCGRP
jgi:acetyl-CoA acetyltransferase